MITVLVLYMVIWKMSKVSDLLNGATHYIQTKYELQSSKLFLILDSLCPHFGHWGELIQNNADGENETL